jgi:hypothetical protein
MNKKEEEEEEEEKACIIGTLFTTRPDPGRRGG